MKKYSDMPFILIFIVRSKKEVINIKTKFPQNQWEFVSWFQVQHISVISSLELFFWPEQFYQMTSGKALNSTWISPICIKHVDEHCYVAMKSSIGGFNDYFFILFSSLLEETSYTFLNDMENTVLHSCICLDISILNKVDTILCYCALKQHITAEFSGVKRNESVSGSLYFTPLSSASDFITTNVPERLCQIYQHTAATWTPLKQFCFVGFLHI